MQTKQQPEDEAHAAFCRYAEAKMRVEQTMDFKDATIAGRAWVEFLNTFAAPHQQMPIGNVVPFPGRRQ